MSFPSILLLAVGLAMDAAAVAAARGLSAAKVGTREAVLIAVYFGGAQALMPLLGYWLGGYAGPWIAAWDHWLAFVLLGAIGAKMLWEARGNDEPEAAPNAALFGARVMLLLAIATSVDAFAVGLMLPVLGAPLLLSLITIGLTTAALSVTGLFAGRQLGARLGRRLDALGGVVLIGLGTKILLQHLTA